MLSIVDMLDGSVPAVLLAHLAVQPVQLPYRLESIVEAAWPGYQPAPFVPSTQAPITAGWGYADGSATFSASPGGSDQTITAVYITADYQGTRFLLSVIPVENTPNSVFKQSGMTYDLSIMAFESQ